MNECSQDVVVFSVNRMGISRLRRFFLEISFWFWYLILEFSWLGCEPDSCLLSGCLGLDGVMLVS